MKTLQFEAVKVALKQDKTGVILTLNIHPDDVPIEVIKDYVGARYQTVMVRLTDDNRPMNRDAEFSRDPVRAAGILCKNEKFAKYLLENGQIFEETTNAVVDWLKSELSITSRAELKENHQAAKRFWAIKEEFELWKNV